MHVVIGGFGRVGRNLAHMLEKEGHTVAVIDRNESVFEEYEGDLKGRKLIGEVFDRNTLVKAGIERADAYAAVTSGDNSNIVAARVARERFNVPNVVARIFDPRRAELYERFGIPTISAVQYASVKLHAMILEPGVRFEATYGGGEVLTLTIAVSSRLVGTTVADLEAKHRFRATAVVHAGIATLPEASTVLADGDRLVLTVERDHLDEITGLGDIEGGE
ncbi:MAG: TrkA family potassium uptake protein [Actinobacteria bacterium]|nr:MAG: TrkA family potassium uptake protein [Actinomycetota bacterium]